MTKILVEFLLSPLTVAGAASGSDRESYFEFQI